jgi:murein DD-endopeptidase MepM/ murein hydrolase activator NlpD
MENMQVRNWPSILGILLGILVLFTVDVSATDYKERMARNKNKHTQLWNRVAELNDVEGELADVLAVVEIQIEEREAEIRRIQKELDAANAEYERIINEQEKLQVAYQDRKEQLATRLRVIYMQDDMTYLDLLFQASGFGELIDRIFLVQTVLENDERLLNQTLETQKQVAEQEISAKEQVADIAAIRLHLQDQMDQLEELRLEQKRDIELIHNDKDLLLREIRELEEANKRIQQQILEAQRNSPYTGQAWSGSFLMPVNGKITSGYGYRTHPVYGVKRMHTGVDIAAPHGTPIKAGGDGKIIHAARNGGYGKTVIIDHGNGRTTLYAHMSSYAVKVGDIVHQGDKVGEVGSTGVSTGNHLHFEVRVNGKHVDPMKQL